MQSTSAVSDCTLSSVLPSISSIAPDISWTRGSHVPSQNYYFGIPFRFGLCLHIYLIGALQNTLLKDVSRVVIGRALGNSRASFPKPPLRKVQIPPGKSRLLISYGNPMSTPALKRPTRVARTAQNGAPESTPASNKTIPASTPGPSDTLISANIRKLGIVWS